MPTEPLLFAAAEVVFDGDYVLKLLMRVLHTSCGATILGALLYMRLVLAPSAVGAQDPALVTYVGGRPVWAVCVAFCSMVLILSGFYNLMTFASTYDNLPALYHPLFGVKFLLALGVMLITALLAGRSALAKRMRGRLIFWLNLAIVMALAIFIISATLRSFRDLPDARFAPARIVTDSTQS